MDREREEGKHKINQISVLATGQKWRMAANNIKG
jgi:hypothetical protein